MLESDGAVATGREAYGQAKKHGQVSLGADGDLVVGRIARNGVEIALATMVYKQRRAAPGVLEGLIPGSGVNVNLRILPDDGEGHRRELVARSFADVVDHEAWEGPATLELHPHAQVPVFRLPVREVVLGLHRVVDLTLPPGRVIHRYP